MASLLLYGLPWLFVAVGGGLLWRARRFMQVAQRVTGTVIRVGVHRSTGSNSGPTYKPVFEFHDPNGYRHEAETFLSASSYNFPIGQQREILVDPSEPTKCRIPGFWVYGFGAIFLVGGLIFALLPLFAPIPIE
ncbi:MAG: DUF3592 domain-containing protein [Pseudomonadota bacterium]